MLTLFIPFNTGLQLDQSLSRLDLEPVLTAVNRPYFKRMLKILEHD